MNDNIDSLIYLSLEIEGLLTLIERREDNTPKVVLAMLRDKASKLKSGIESLDPDFKKASPAVDEADNRIAVSAEFEMRSDADISHDLAVSTPAPAPAPAHAPVVVEPAQAPVVESPAPVAAPVEPEVKTPVEASVADAPASKTLGDMHKAFTLNDKFRFRRELFHNSDEEFSEALTVISTMNSTDEVADYLYNDLCLDPSSDDVKEFLGVITAFIDR